MPSVDFPGSRQFIAAIDAAVAHDNPRDLVNALRHALCELIRDPSVRLPDCVFECVPGHYARRELYSSSEHGYCVIAMTWGPGQGTPLHDHFGMWCVEGVWHGQLEVTPYELMQQDNDNDRWRFETRGTMQAGPGSAGSLIPPHDYHTIRNPSSQEAAVTVHIYRNAMTQCAVFEPLGDGWYRRNERMLSLDNTHGPKLGI